MTRMSIPILAGLAALLLAASPATAATVDLVVRTVDATDPTASPPYWFEVTGKTGKNPALQANPGDTVNINLTNVGNYPHNWVLQNPSGQAVSGAAVGATAPLTKDKSGNATFTVPSTTGTYKYVCTIHADSMKGDFVVGTAGNNQGGGNNTGGDTKNGTPGFEAAFALLALAGVAVFLARRRA